MSGITKIINSFYNSNIGKKLANPAATAATATAIAAVSNVSKDAVNCAYYTIQSLNNERIPEDQRKFVAALDLSNGILNVFLQIAMAFGLTSGITAIFDNTFAKTKPFSTSEPFLKERYNALAKDLKASTTYENFAKGVKPILENRCKAARLGFSVLFANIAMQILTKRIITPLIATPMASGFKRKFEESEAKKAGQKAKVVANA